MIQLLLLAVGLCGIVGSPIVLRKVRSKGVRASPIVRGLVVAAGIGFAVAGYWGYPYPERSGDWGRVLGVPFLAAYFDSNGFDYVGPLSIVAALGNVAFWLLAPQACLSIALVAKKTQTRLSAVLLWTVPALCTVLAAATVAGSMSATPKRPPPEPPPAMSAEPCPTGMTPRITTERAPRRESWRWTRDCIGSDGKGHGTWKVWTADGRVVSEGTWPERPAGDAGSNPPEGQPRQ